MQLKGLGMATGYGTLRAITMAFGVLLFSCSAHAQQKLRIGVLPISESLPVVVADKQGFFQAEGLTVDLVKFDSGAVAVPVLQSGRLDIVFSNTVATLQAIEQGLDATVLMPGAVVRPEPPDSTTALIVRKGEIKSPKDLEGKRIAVNVINSSAWLHAVAALEKRGVDHTKVRFVEVPFPQMNDTLLRGQVDAIGQAEPFRTPLIETGKVEIVSWTYVETAPNTLITEYIALTPWVEKNRDPAAKFVRAVRKAVDFIATNETYARDINQQFTNLNPALKEKVVLPRFGTTVEPEALTRVMEMMRTYGLLKAPIDISKRLFSEAH
jgi:NitT/TauT family transport system substrate-binding protein